MLLFELTIAIFIGTALGDIKFVLTVKNQMIHNLDISHGKYDCWNPGDFALYKDNMVRAMDDGVFLAPRARNCSHPMTHENPAYLELKFKQLPDWSPDNPYPDYYSPEPKVPDNECKLSLEYLSGRGCIVHHKSEECNANFKVDFLPGCPNDDFNLEHIMLTFNSIDKPAP